MTQKKIRVHLFTGLLSFQFMDTFITQILDKSGIQIPDVYRIYLGGFILYWINIGAIDVLGHRKKKLWNPLIKLLKELKHIEGLH